MTANAQSALRGKQIVVTQAVHQAPELAGLLSARGAKPLLYPCIAIAPPVDPVPLDDALYQAAGGAFDWLVLTSANTVLAIAQRLSALGLSARDFSGIRIAAIGPATAAALAEQVGRSADLIPVEHVAEGLATSITAVVRSGARLLLPQADLARAVLARNLAAAGLLVTQVTAYSTTVGSGGVNLPELLQAGAVDAITFTSGSTVDNLLVRMSAAGIDRSCLAAVSLACIGPVTADAARKAGLTVAVVAGTQSLAGLVEALDTYWSEHEYTECPICGGDPACDCTVASNCTPATDAAQCHPAPHGARDGALA